MAHASAQIILVETDNIIAECFLTNFIINKSKRKTYESIKNNTFLSVLNPYNLSEKCTFSINIIFFFSLVVNENCFTPLKFFTLITKNRDTYVEKQNY